MTGPEALAAFNAAVKLVNQGKYVEAICVDMLDSDILVIVGKIKSANRAKTTKES